jgi:phosphatidylinositol-3,4,5-trisphosphate 3-phosphatase and dual-specificity protein phosphatase PTEN
MVQVERPRQPLHPPHPPHPPHPLHPQVQQLFRTYHAPDNYRIYNLCAERVYTGVAFGGEAHPNCLRHFPFDDHNPPCLDLISQICDDAAGFLAANPAHVVAIHCKAGKGRTGCIIACLLVHLGICKTADEARA